MRQPAKPKPDEVAETARVMRIFDWVAGEMDMRPRAEAWRKRPADILIVAERIAARTEPAA